MSKKTNKSENILGVAAVAAVGVAVGAVAAIFSDKSNRDKAKTKFESGKSSLEAKVNEGKGKARVLTMEGKKKAIKVLDAAKASLEEPSKKDQL